MDVLEKSWDGFETHTEQGYNVGKPCYGYRAKQIPHPVSAKRAKGLKKTLLQVDPKEGAVVRKAFHWRVVERLGYGAIADRLNEDLILNPPPTPILVEQAAGRWNSSNVRDMLTNPKHTGHMVWNRRARKGGGRNRPNPVSEWVWSPEPTHEALVDLETYVKASRSLSGVSDRGRRAETGILRRSRSTGCEATSSVSFVGGASTVSPSVGSVTTSARRRRDASRTGIPSRRTG